jgi:hypothetical protein
MNKTPKYPLPDFLSSICSPKRFSAWLNSQATRHCKRDRNRGNADLRREAIKRAIHIAVVQSRGLDAYTGHMLDWQLIGTYSNAESAVNGRAYKRRFHGVPSVDHVGDGLGAPDFRICAWRTNDCKSDLTYDEFIEFCRSVLSHHEQPAEGTSVRV